MIQAKQSPPAGKVQKGNNDERVYLELVRIRKNIVFFFWLTVLSISVFLFLVLDVWNM